MTYSLILTDNYDIEGIREWALEHDLIERHVEDFYCPGGGFVRGKYAEWDYYYTFEFFRDEDRTLCKLKWL